MKYFILFFKFFRFFFFFFIIYGFLTFPIGTSNLAAPKKYSYTTKSKNFKNLSFVSNDSTNYDSESLTLNSYRLNTQINNNMPEPNVNASVFLNQSLNVSGNISSRRNTYENIKSQDYSNFLNEWKNLHFYHKNSNIQENNGEILNIVPEETNEENTVIYYNFFDLIK